jgi:hypothetical protein
VPPGPVVRLGPNLLSFNTNTALKNIYDHGANVRKADFYTAFPATKQAVNVHSSIDKPTHARKRRVISHAFSDKAIRSMDRYILANIAQARNLIASDVVQAATTATQNDDVDVDGGESKSKGGGWSRPRNMARWADWLTFDIMGDLVFGKAFGMLESPQNRFAVDLVSSAAHRHLIVR